MSTKLCKLCKEQKPLNDFPSSYSNKGSGKHSYCRPCLSKYGTNKQREKKLKEAKENLANGVLPKNQILSTYSLDGKKICRSCRERKDLNWFYQNPHTMYYASMCQPCKLAYSKKHNKVYKEQRINFVLFNTARVRARKYGLPFNIIPEDVVIPNKCPILGIDLFVKGGKSTDNSPTLDRIVPALGYVKGNIKVISRLANRMKQDNTEESLEKLLAYVRENK